MLGPEPSRLPGTVPIPGTVRMSKERREPIGSHVADGMDVPRSKLAAALAHGASHTTVCEHVVATVAAELVADLELCEQADRLSAQQRSALQRAESQAAGAIGVGIPAGTARRIAPGDGAEVTVLHGDGWSLVARGAPVLMFLLDVAPGLVIDRSRAHGAATLVAALAAQLP
jgi:hypothetical protein